MTGDWGTEDLSRLSHQFAARTNGKPLGGGSLSAPQKSKRRGVIMGATHKTWTELLREGNGGQETTDEGRTRLIKEKVTYPPVWKRRRNKKGPSVIS